MVGNGTSLMRLAALALLLFAASCGREEKPPAGPMESDPAVRLARYYVESDPFRTGWNLACSNRPPRNNELTAPVVDSTGVTFTVHWRAETKAAPELPKMLCILIDRQHWSPNLHPSNQL